MANRKPVGNVQRELTVAPASAAENSLAGKFSLLACALILGTAFVAYHNSLTGAFVFDDTGAITENPTIRQLWPLWPVLTKADFATVVSRPLLNVSLAVNYALGGTNPLGYHIVNIIIHAFAGLTLFGVLRRTFRLPSLQGHAVSRAPNGLALAAALLWTVHPLQTESVTYVCQRAEALAGLFYLLVFYGVLRAVESLYPWRWYCLAVLAGWLGVTTKETLATAPVLLLVYDRLFLADSWRNSLRRRWALYAALVASWILLAVLMLHSGGRHDSAGFGRGMSAWEYARTQPYYIVHYLWLTFWPRSLVLDYGQYVAQRVGEILPYALILSGLLVAALWCLRRCPELGYCGLWFFGTLAPTSSFVPLITQTGAEHRTYLSLVALVVPAVAAGYKWLSFAARHLHLSENRQRYIACSVVGVLVTMLGGLTVRRNKDYRSELSIWSDVVAKRPDNPRAQSNLGKALADAGRTQEGIAHLSKALRLKPDLVETHFELGLALVQAGRIQEALRQYEEALRLNPQYAEVHDDLGIALVQTGRIQEALQHYEEALRLKPGFAEARNNLGLALVQAGRIQEAIRHYEEALRLKPGFAEAHNNLGLALVQAGRIQEALPHYEEALRLKPDSVEAHNNLGIALVRAGRIQEALGHFEQAARIRPDDAEAQYNLGLVLTQTGRFQEAIMRFQEALRVRPDYPEAQAALEQARAQASDHGNRNPP